MNRPTGPLIASGRAADVFDQGDGTVLRRYRGDHGAELEARIMTWVRANGAPVPEVHHSEGRDLVMERISGVTMFDDLRKRPWMVMAHGRLLASLQSDLNALHAPSWFPKYADVPTGLSVVHLDLHPMNVMLGAQGPMIIDWTNASMGQGSFDAALSFVVMSTFETSGLQDRIGQRAFTSVFARSSGREELERSLRDACAYRLADKNLSAGERASVEQMVANNPA